MSGGHCPARRKFPHRVRRGVDRALLRKGLEGDQAARTLEIPARASRVSPEAIASGHPHRLRKSKPGQQGLPAMRRQQPKK
jgi:hypothetical protein